jgi:enoyl-CoA hydratase/carnithine racemase
MSPSEVARLFAGLRAGSEELLGALDGTPLLQVDLDAGADELSDAPPPWLPCVVLGYANRAKGDAPSGVDLALTREGADVGTGWVTASDLQGELLRVGRASIVGSQAAVVLAQVLRTSEGLDTAAALMVESLAYSTLQSGPGFSAWLASRSARRPSTDDKQPLLLEREGGTLQLTLNRPQVRNAVNGRLRDELCEALSVACTDPSVAEVALYGAGPSFCSGGDLDEFGTLPDPVTAHLTRTTRSPARLLATLAPRVTAFVHGACVGAGIELAAFAGRVVSTPDARFSLPELGMWLIPGAGGTVSIPRRIGRQRTAWLALGGETLDAPSAQRWGLVDELSDEHVVR